MLELARKAVEVKVGHPLTEGNVVQEELDIPISKHGGIIGKRGVVINSLQDELHCEIQLPEGEERGHSSIVRVLSLDPEGAAAVRKRLEEILELEHITVLSAECSRTELDVYEVSRQSNQHPPPPSAHPPIVRLRDLLTHSRTTCTVGALRTRCTAFTPSTRFGWRSSFRADRSSRRGRMGRRWTRWTSFVSGCRAQRARSIFASSTSRTAPLQGAFLKFTEKECECVS